jgi:hypothetical protein
MPGPRSVISEYLPPPCGPCRYVVVRDKPVHKLMVQNQCDLSAKFGGMNPT